jgi:hypothetical protein
MPDSSGSDDSVSGRPVIGLGLDYRTHGLGRH